MSAPHRSRKHQRDNIISAPSVTTVSVSVLTRHAEDLRHNSSTNDLSISALRKMGHQIALSLSTKKASASSVSSRNDDDNDVVAGTTASGPDLHAAGLEAAALFTAACSVRSEKDQGGLLGMQDKILAGLRGLSSSSSLTPGLRRSIRAALLPLVTQSGFSKKRGGYRQHLVQALTEASAGPVPPSALLPILRAKETGPSASDLALEVLESVANLGGAAGCKAVLELLHHVVAEVVISGASKGGKGATKGPAPHLLAFLVQACSTLPGYILVYSKDLLALVESRSNAARKLSIAVLGIILDHIGECRGILDPALTAVLRLARSDGDATVRCAAFDCVTERLGREEGAFHLNSRYASGDGGLDKECDAAHGKSVSPVQPRQGSPLEARGDDTENIAPLAEQVDVEVAPRSRQLVPRSNDGNGHSEMPQAPMEVTAGDASRRPRDETVAFDPWAVGGVLLTSLSASAGALSKEFSKAVRAKAIVCSLRILETHGSLIESRVGCDGADDEGRSEMAASKLYDVEMTLRAVAKGAWAALEAIAADNGAISQASLGAIAGARHRRAADACRDLLSLPCVGVKPLDIITCYERCQSVPRAGVGTSPALVEAKAALQHVARVRFCGDIYSLLRAVSEVMLADDGGGNMEGGFGGAGVDGAIGEGAVASSPSEVLCELLAGISNDVITSLLHAALDAYSRLDGDPQGQNAPVLLRAIALLGGAKGNVGGAEGKGQRRAENGDKLADGARCAQANDHGCLLAKSQHLFWRSLELRMEDIKCEARNTSYQNGVFSGERGGSDEGINGDNTDQTDQQKRVAMSVAVREVAELLRIFQLLASRSSLSPENEPSLETIVFPSALSTRRLIRPAVGLALALEEPQRVLLSSLAVLQDATFARSSTNLGRACDYVRLIGVLAKENASFIAAHVREQYSGHRSASAECDDEGDEETTRQNDDGDYMAGASNREAQEREIRRLLEASVTSDGMLSCYTPFLLAIVKRRVADSAIKAPSVGKSTAVSRSSCTCGGSDSAGNCGGECGVIGQGENDGRSVAAAPEQSPPTLCAEALWALSEYAVLSPTLAAAEVLPLAEQMAGDELEHPLVRNAAACVFTRRELATDEIAARACRLLEDQNPRLRQEVLRRLGRLMRESRIKTAHLSRFALHLVDEDGGVRETAFTVFVQHLQPRPDSVCRCIFETFFTLEAEEEMKRNVLRALITVAQRAAPSRGLGSLGGALMRKAAETVDADAAFFLSLVPPTNMSHEVAEIALRRGQLAQAPHGVLSLMVTHFANGGGRGRSATAVGQTNAGDGVGGDGVAGRGAADFLSKAQTIEMAERIGRLTARHRLGRTTTAASATATAGDGVSPAASRRLRGQRAKYRAVERQSDDAAHSGRGAAFKGKEKERRLSQKGIRVSKRKRNQSKGKGRGDCGVGGDSSDAEREKNEADMDMSEEEEEWRE